MTNKTKEAHMRNINDIKKVGAKVYYRDRLDEESERHGYVQGTVIEFKTITDAERDWGQKWTRRKGTILKIRNDKDPSIYRYRHTAAVITETQYEEKIASKAAAVV